MPADLLTVDDVIRLVCGNTKRGSTSRDWEKMTPSRYGQLCELAETDAASGEVLRAAEQRINASAWLKKPALEVTAADVEQLLAAKPWEAV
jgi:hypothetical protein